MNFTHEISTSPNLVSNVTLYGPESYIYILAFSFNVIFGLPINFYVLWLICTGTGNGLVAELLNLNLTVCEIAYCLIRLVFFVCSKCEVILNMTYFSTTLLSVGRPLINCLICIERYLAVLHPVSFLKFKPLRYRLLCSAVIWVIVHGFGGLFVLFSTNRCKFVWLYLPLFSVLLSTELFCSLAIVRALKHPGPGEKGNGRKEANHIKKKATVVILILTMTMFVQYAPMIFIGFLYSTLSEAELALSIGVAIFFMCGYVSPILYIYRVRNL